MPTQFIRSGCYETCGAFLDKGPKAMNSVVAMIVDMKLLVHSFSSRPACLVQLLPDYVRK